MKKDTSINQLTEKTSLFTRKFKSKPLKNRHLLFLFLLILSGIFLYIFISKYYKYEKLKNVPRLTTPSPISLSNNPITKKYSQVNQDEYFITSPLLSNSSGLYFDYSKYTKRYLSDITEEVKKNYPVINYFPNPKYYTPFTINIWSYLYNPSHSWWQKEGDFDRDDTNFSYQINEKTNFADIGIRAVNNQYPPLTFSNLKKYLGNIYVIKDLDFVSSVFSLDDKAIVFEWTPRYPVINGFDDHSTLLATMYINGPNRNSLTNAIQLRVVMPSFEEVVEDRKEWPGKIEVPDPNNIGTIKLQQVIDSYLKTIVDIFGEIDYK